MTISYTDSDPIQGAGEALLIHRPMNAGHRQALVQVAREFYQRVDPDAETDSLASNITVDDGDLIWHSGGGYDILFTIGEVHRTHVIRAMEKRSEGWITVSDQLVDPSNAASTATTIWQLITLLTNGETVFEGRGTVASEICEDAEAGSTAPDKAVRASDPPQLWASRGFFGRATRLNGNPYLSITINGETRSFEPPNTR